MNPRNRLDPVAHGELTNVRFAHIYRRPTIGHRISRQARNGEAKPYHLRQLLEVVERRALRLKENDQ